MKKLNDLIISQSDKKSFLRKLRLCIIQLSIGIFIELNDFTEDGQVNYEDHLSEKDI
jgi:hypothetical protein